MKQILIIKTGALGDVVRTSFFAKYLNEQFDFEIHWLASESSKDIVLNNPFIKKVYLNSKEIPKVNWDIVFSLEDEMEFITLATTIEKKKLVGLFLENDKVRYDEITSYWNNMGIHSTFGLEKANELKYKNKLSHLEIYSQIFQVESPKPNWKGKIPNFIDNKNKKNKISLGINPFAGKRWPGKEIPIKEINLLLNKIQENDKFETIYLFGEYSKWIEVDFHKFNKCIYLNTENDINLFAQELKRIQILITSDSLAVHMASALGIPFICFFGPTSASEVSVPNLPHINIISDRPGYCSYSPKAKIEGLNANKIYSCLNQLIR